MEAIREAIEHFWGYETLMPLQDEAMRCVLDRRDSVVVLPTGGGKSLCFQAPAVAGEGGMAVVVSPLIALMKDQVDGLRENGVAAARLDSMLDPREYHETLVQVERGEIRLLYVSPERLVMDSFLAMLDRVGVAFFAIDEAHCISMWGHDFRPEYRMLSLVKDRFPDASVHAYTATATRRVQEDIAAGLGLREPSFLVGSFFRPNLQYSARRRESLLAQVREVVDRHPGESGIVYCIKRDDVDSLAENLRAAGYGAEAYHAGLEDGERRAVQERFQRDETPIIVATVAFGMGVHKPDARFVVHTGAPKSLEHYQQESGRAGRDGLPSECVLLYGGVDFGKWRNILAKIEDDEAREIALRKIRDMSDYCQSTRCRHKTLIEYFGQAFDKTNCEACDVCLDSLERIPDAFVVTQKILCAVARLDERYGAHYTSHVLKGSRDDKVAERGHDKVKTFGALKDEMLSQIRDWIENLVEQEYLRKESEYNILKITPKGRALIRTKNSAAPDADEASLENPILTRRRAKPKRKARAEVESMEGVDRALLDRLKDARRELAKGKPAYIVFSDRSLIDMARLRPSTPEAFLHVNGVGQSKLRKYGDAFLEAIRLYCEENGVATDMAPPDELF